MVETPPPHTPLLLSVIRQQTTSLTKYVDSPVSPGAVLCQRCVDNVFTKAVTCAGELSKSGGGEGNKSHMRKITNNALARVPLLVSSLTFCTVRPQIITVYEMPSDTAASLL